MEDWKGGGKMAQSNSQTLVLSFTTNKSNLIRIQINQPKADLQGSEIKAIMESLISLGAITNTSEEVLYEIKGAGITNKTIESISF